MGSEFCRRLYEIKAHGLSRRGFPTRAVKDAGLVEILGVVSNAGLGNRLRIKSIVEDRFVVGRRGLENAAESRRPLLRPPSDTMSRDHASLQTGPNCGAGVSPARLQPAHLAGWRILSGSRGAMGPGYMRVRSALAHLRGATMTGARRRSVLRMKCLRVRSICR